VKEVKGYPVGLVKEETEVGEDDPESLPLVARLELTQEESAEKFLWIISLIQLLKT